MTGGGLAAAQHRPAADAGHRRALPRRRERPQLRGPGHRPGAGALRVLQELAGPAHLAHGQRRARTGPASPGLAPSSTCTRHSSASFDSLADPRRMVERARSLGLTHLAITDHERIDGARRAADLAPDDLQVIVGEEVRTRDGDLIGLFLHEAVAPGLTRGGHRSGHPGAGRPGRAAPPVRRLPRLGRQPCRGRGGCPRRAGFRGRFRRGPQRARLSRRQPCGGGLRGAPRAARRGLLGRPQRHGGGHRQHRPARAVLDGRGAPGAAPGGTAADRSRVVLRARSGRPWPSSSSGCGATVASRSGRAGAR